MSDVSTEEIENKVKTYNQRVDNLYKEIISWLEEKNVNFKTEFKDITNKEHFAEYQTKQLIIYDDNKILAELKPIGIWVVGALGRVDLVGFSGSEILMYLSETGLSIKIKIDDRENKKKIPNNKEEGWHWLDDRIIGKTPKLTKDIFFALLERIN